MIEAWGNIEWGTEEPPTEEPPIEEPPTEELLAKEPTTENHRVRSGIIDWAGDPATEEPSTGNYWPRKNAQNDNDTEEV